MQQSMKQFIATIAAVVLVPIGGAWTKDCDQFTWSVTARFPEPTQGVGHLTTQIVSDPAVAMDSSGRLHVFAIGQDGALWHSIQTLDKQSWQDLASLGNPAGHSLKTGRNDVRLTAIADRLGLINVFVIADGFIWTIRQLTTAAEDVWEPWRRLPVSASGTPEKIWVGSNADGHIELFAEHDQVLDHTWQHEDRTWFPTFTAFGWPSGAYDQLAISRDRAGRLVVAAVTINSAFVRRQVFPNVDWGDWTDIGGPSGGLGPLVAMAVNADGRLEMLAEQQLREDGRPSEGIYDNDLFHTWQSDENTWAGTWSQLGAPFSFMSWAMLDAAMTQGRDGCIAVTAVSSIRSTHQNPQLPRVRVSPLYQKQPSSIWNSWNQGRGTGWSAAAGGRLIVVERSDNYLELFLRAADGTWLHASQLRNQIIQN